MDKLKVIEVKKMKKRSRLRRRIREWLKKKKKQKKANPLPSFTNVMNRQQEDLGRVDELYKNKKLNQE